MMAIGLLKEAEHIYDLIGDKDCTAAKAIGYRELFSYFRGECTLDDAVARIKQDSRHFAKRQLTWFRRYPDVIWIDRRDFGSTAEIVEYMSER